MTNVGMQNITPSTADVSIIQGYHNGSGRVLGDADLVSSNILAGVTLFGVEGDSNVVNTSSGDALAANILLGKKAWVDGVEVTGSISTGAISPTSTSIAAGYYDATDLTTVDGDLVSANILAGVTLFGVEGDSNVVNTSSGDALAANILLGKKAWVDGVEVTGSIPTGAISSTSTSIAAGYYDATDLTSVEVDLVSANILAGVTLFGVEGDSNVVNTSTGDALAANILLGKKAWVDGEEVTGVLAGGVSTEGGTFSAGQRWCIKGDYILDTTTGVVWVNDVFYGHLNDGYPINCIRSNICNSDPSYRLASLAEVQELLTGPEAISSSYTGFFASLTSATYWTCTANGNGTFMTINPRTGATGSAVYTSELVGLAIAPNSAF